MYFLSNLFHEKKNELTGWLIADLRNRKNIIQIEI